MDMNLRKLFKACPYCGKRDKLMLTSRQAFEELQKENGGAAVGLECVRCWATMYEHTHAEKSYYKRVAMLAEKWNTRTEEEEEDDDE